MKIGVSFHRAFFWLRIGLTFACLLAIGSQFHSARPWHNFHIVNATPLFLGISLVFPLLTLRGYKWLVLLRTIAPQATLKNALRSYLGALPLSLITPGKAGELIRGLYLPYAETRGLRSAGLTTIDNWADFAAVGFWTLPVLTVLAGPKSLWMGFLICIILCCIPLWLRAIHMLSLLLPSGKIKQGWNRFWPDPTTLGWRSTLFVISIGIVAYGVEWLQMHFLLTSLGSLEMGFSTLAGNLALVQWANSVQITVAGLGLREGSTAWLLNRSGSDAQIALIAAFFQTSISLLIPALLGLLIKPISPKPVILQVNSSSTEILSHPPLK